MVRAISEGYPSAIISVFGALDSPDRGDGTQHRGVSGLSAWGKQKGK